MADEGADQKVSKQSKQKAEEVGREYILQLKQ
jgi:hypothetical protein